MKWFTTVSLLSFYVGSVNIAVELDRKTTYIGLQWVTSRSRLHIFIGLLLMARVHITLPSKKRARQTDEALVEVDEGITEAEAGAETNRNGQSD